MLITVAVDSDQLKTAASLTGITDPSAIIREGLQALIERERVKKTMSTISSEASLLINSRDRHNIK